MTGLNCGDVPTPSISKVIKNNIADKFLNTRENQRIKSLMYIFQSQSSATDEELVSLANLCILETVLLPRQPAVLIKSEHIELANDRELFASYPWGRLSYMSLVESLHKSKNFVENDSQGYDIGGFIHPLISWAFEIIPMFVERGFTTRNPDAITPRMLKWTYYKKLNFDELSNKVFENPQVKFGLLDL